MLSGRKHIAYKVMLSYMPFSYLVDRAHRRRQAKPHGGAFIRGERSSSQTTGTLQQTDGRGPRVSSVLRSGGFGFGAGVETSDRF